MKRTQKSVGFPDRVYPPPPFLARLGSSQSVRTPKGLFLLEGLFYEASRHAKEAPPIFTLEFEDRTWPPNPEHQLYSFHKRFVELMDPTGYLAGIDLLGSYEHWKRLQKCNWFQPYLNGMVEEVVAKLRSEAIVTYRDLAKKGDAKALGTLMDFQPTGEHTPQPKRGRPSKKDVKQAAREIAAEDSDLQNDIDRLRNLEE